MAASTPTAAGKTSKSVEEVLQECRDFDAKWKDFQDSFGEVMDKLANKIAASIRSDPTVIGGEAISTEESWDEESVVEQKVAALAEAIRSAAGRVVLFTGAGLSTAAGVPDYRSPFSTKLKTGPGVWTRRAAAPASKNEQATASAKKAKNDIAVPANVKDIGRATPTAAHIGIAKLLKNGYIKHVISQNIDGLHLLSGIPLSSLSELHGNAYVTQCRQCSQTCVQKTPVKHVTLKKLETGKGRKADTCDFCRDIYPKFCHCVDGRCSECPSAGDKPMVDTIVHFGENLRSEVMDRAKKEAETADLCIILGSSCRVAPAASLPLLAKRCFVINAQPTSIDSVAEDSGGQRIGATCDRVLTLLCDILDVTSK